MKIKLLELFSGIGGFAKGLTDAGFEIETHLFSEIDKHAIACYQYNFKNAQSIGSVTDVRGSGIERPDIISFGSPCQDFSLAGKRAGMDGQRSSLITEAIRIIGECRPSLFIWENVKGAFSSNAGADFWAIIAAFANIGGYRLEWQLVNTSWVLPQNRERIYLIGHLDGRSTPSVFPFRESDLLYNKRQQTKSSRIASTLNAGDHKSWVGNFLNIKSNTKSGYETATVGDGINFNQPNSKTRRGRVGKGVAQTIDTNGRQGVLLPFMTNPKMNNYTPNYKNSVSITARSYKEPPLINNIRRLTEIECERLQGFPDDWTKWGDYDGKIKEIPKTQRYKLIGNAVTTNIVKLIGERLLNHLNKKIAA